MITEIIQTQDAGTCVNASVSMRLTNFATTRLGLLLVLAVGCSSDNQQQSPADSAPQTEPDTSHGPTPASPAPAVLTIPDISIFDAAGNGDADAIKQHIAAGTDIHVKQPDTGNTPLHNACSMGHTEVAKLLIEAGAAIEAKSNEQTTPLFNAAFLCHTEVVKLLLEHGANVHTTDKNGASLVDVMAAPWEVVAEIYQLVYSLMGVEFDAETTKAIRPVILKTLREHIAKGQRPRIGDDSGKNRSLHHGVSATP